MRSEQEIDMLVEPILGGMTLPLLFDEEKVDHLRTPTAEVPQGVILIVG